MTKTQKARFEKKVSALESGTVALSSNDIVGNTDTKGRKTLGFYLKKSASSNYHGIDEFLLSCGIDDLHGVDEVETTSLSTHSPVVNARRAARALRRVAGRHEKA